MASRTITCLLVCLAFAATLQTATAAHIYTGALNWRFKAA